MVERRSSFRDGVPSVAEEEQVSAVGPERGCQASLSGLCLQVSQGVWSEGGCYPVWMDANWYPGARTRIEMSDTQPPLSAVWSRPHPSGRILQGTRRPLGVQVRPEAADWTCHPHIE